TTMQNRPIQSVLDCLGRIIPLERHFSLVPCFPACIGFFRAKWHASQTPWRLPEVDGTTKLCPMQFSRI
ncbi:MAG: hypothetical protein LBI05_06105, partial [Planctomycetaceae bacterium]|nr:hypothetical protein [Planctomycetaceae bacterium]